MATKPGRVPLAPRPEPFGRPLREVLTIPALAQSTVVAGQDGLGRFVERLNVIGSPEPFPWLKPNELLLSTSYPLRHRRAQLAEYIERFDELGLAGLAIKSRPYLTDLPQDMLDLADERGFPVIDVPEHISFDEIITQALTGILNQQAEILTRVEEVHRTILDIMVTGGGLDEIAAQVSKLIGGPAGILSSGGELLAGTSAGTDQGDDFERLDQVAANLGGEDGEVEGAGFVTLPIVMGGRVLGHMVGLENSTPLRPDVKLVLEHAATMAALEMAKANELAAVEGKYQINFVHELLSGRFSSREDAVQRARAFGWDLGRELVVYVIRPTAPQGQRLPQDGPTAPMHPRVLATVRSVDPHAAVVELSTEIMAVVGTESTRALPGGVRRTGQQILDNHPPGIAIGISRPVGDVLELGTAYQQAHRALTVGRRFAGTQPVVEYDDLGAQRLLALIPNTAFLREFVADTLRQLAANDDRSRDLRRTLEVLLQTNVNIAETARLLHFHYNTLRYRVRRLESIVGPFTTDSSLRLDLQLALMIVHMDEVWA